MSVRGELLQGTKGVKWRLCGVQITMAAQRHCQDRKPKASM